MPTFAEELARQRPGGRVVTVSLKARSAIGLAGRKGDAVTWFDEVAGAFVTSQAFAPAPVPPVKAAIDARPFDKDLGAAWQLRDPETSYRNPDDGAGERPPEGWSRQFPHELKGKAGADGQFFNLWRRSPYGDAYTAYLATALVDAYGLGRARARPTSWAWDCPRSIWLDISSDRVAGRSKTSSRGSTTSWAR
jgi:hypothetical protein